MAAGGILYHYILHKYQSINLHTILAISLALVALFSILFSNIFILALQNVIIFASAMAYCFVEITLVSCLLKTVEKQYYSYWLLIQTGFFGVGALCSPFLVYLF